MVAVDGGAVGVLHRGHRAGLGAVLRGVLGGVAAGGEAELQEDAERAEDDDAGDHEAAGAARLRGLRRVRVGHGGASLAGRGPVRKGVDGEGARGVRCGARRGWSR
ncbi:MAG: hypothetical protein H6703_01215 [Myxococcales bacterium]|nr:hypothetical protein [Myxococcales bacterium]